MAAPSRRVSTLLSHLSPSSPALLALSAPVAAALAEGAPVVALESTILCHGLPYPANLDAALRVEEVVRTHGAIPATVAVLGGVPHVGLTRRQLETLARKGPRVKKCSRRDLPGVVGRGEDGATTVSGTMVLAARAGVPVFVTGGIGGVHRGGEVSMDVSADLTELGRTRMCVVCAGAKSLLDIPRTLEVLETEGVCVAALGQDDFPAFFAATSGCRAPLRVEDEEEAAAVMAGAMALGYEGSVLIGVPPPPSEEAGEAQEALEAAIGEAEVKGVRGNALTPFLLSRTHESSAGKSLRVNVALVLNNAEVGAKIAVHLQKRERETTPTHTQKDTTR